MPCVAFRFEVELIYFNSSQVLLQWIRQQSGNIFSSHRAMHGSPSILSLCILIVEIPKV